MQNIRIFFKKTGRAKYISHLNMNTLWARVIRRAGVNMWYTEGFHPHMYMTFALPLSLGVESLCESVDMRLMDNISFDELLVKLNEALPEGIEIYKIAEPNINPKFINSAEYEVTLYSLSDYKDAFDSFIKKDNIEAIKKGKAGERAVNLKDYILSADSETQNSDLILNLKLLCGTQNTLNPQLLIDTFLNDININSEGAKIVRTAVFDKDGNLFN